jgi:RsiW-degrading membrane proteinase PrsW (M82 family)
MNWRSTLQTKTRDPRFLWQMVLGIIAAGIVAGYAAQYFWQTAPVDPGELILRNHGAPHPVVELERLAAQGKWVEVWWAIPKSQWWRIAQRGPVILAALTGGCWLLFMLQALQVRGPLDPRLWLALAAVPLGVLSVWPTHFFALWQEFAWGLEENMSLFHGLRFFTLGVGLREETAKLLCLLPLMPLLLRLHSDLAAMLTSGCVGIGFALAENAGYFASTGGVDTLGRYLTANPFHLTLTGLIGLAVYRAFRHPRDWGPQALATFGLMVFAHGLYDAFIGVPVLAEYSLLGTIIFAAVVYQFFRELRDARQRRPDVISLTANFLCGVSLVTSAAFVYLSATVGCSDAFDFLFQGAAGLAVMVYLFLREMPETMVTV